MPIDGPDNSIAHTNVTASQHTETAASVKTAENTTVRLGQAALNQPTREPRPVQEHQVQSLEDTLIRQSNELHNEIDILTNQETKSPDDEKLLKDMKKLLNETRNLVLKPYRAVMEKIANEYTGRMDQQAINVLKKEYENTKRELEKKESELPPESPEPPASTTEFKENKSRLNDLIPKRDLLQAKDRTLLEENQLDKMNREISKLEKQQAAYNEKGAVEGGSKPEVPAKLEKKELPVEVKTEIPQASKSFSFLRSLFKAAEGILQFFNIKAQYSKETNNTQREIASRDIGTLSTEGKLEREVQQQALYNEILARGTKFEGVPEKYTNLFIFAQNWCRAEDGLKRAEAALSKCDPNSKEFEGRNERVKNARTQATNGKSLVKQDFEQMKSDIEKMRNVGMEKAYPKEFNQFVELYHGLEKVLVQNGELNVSGDVGFMMAWANNYYPIKLDLIVNLVYSNTHNTFGGDRLYTQRQISLDLIHNAGRVMRFNDPANETLINQWEKYAEMYAQIIETSTVTLRELTKGVGDGTRILDPEKQIEAKHKEAIDTARKQAKDLQEQIMKLKKQMIPNGKLNAAYIQMIDGLAARTAELQSQLNTLEKDFASMKK